MQIIVYKEKRIKELKELDCNCNDCVYLERHLSKRQNHVDFHFDMQKHLFNTKRIKLLLKGETNLRKSKKDNNKFQYYKNKAKENFKEARKMIFISSEDSCSLFFGKCLLRKIIVSFIPNILQLDTKDCFKIR